MPYEIPTTKAGLRSEASAATRRGMTPEQYRARRMAGWYYCPSCERWLMESDFRRDASKASGVGGTCKGCDASRRNIDPEKRRQRNERRAAMKAEREARREAKRKEYLRRQEEAAQQYQEPKRVTDKPPVLPYSLRNNRPGALTEALRIDTRGGQQ